ncbi:MAG TPA: ATP synthase F1 subunit delta [Acidimicrobiia bacterium]|nr:ATP synthase F1 subunit delta [Acidimicrobiia bacterium]
MTEHGGSTSAVEGYARAMLEVARSEGVLDVVEDELFRVARTFEASDELRSKLADQSIPVALREAIVEDLLGSEGATTITRSIVGFIVAAGRASQLPAIVDAFVQQAAAARDHVVAEVRTAVPLDDERRQRLAAALSTATKKRVEVKVIVDDSVVGGLVAKVGDQVIDGSVRSRLQELRETL